MLQLGREPSWFQTEVAGVVGGVESQSEADELAYESIETVEAKPRASVPWHSEEDDEASEGDRLIDIGPRQLWPVRCKMASTSRLISSHSCLLAFSSPCRLHIMKLEGKVSLSAARTYRRKASTNRDRAWRRWTRAGLGGGGAGFEEEETLDMMGESRAERSADGLLNPLLLLLVLLEDPDLEEARECPVGVEACC